MRSAVSALSLACACLVIQGGDAFTLTSTPLAHKAGAARISPSATAGNRLNAAKVTLRETAATRAAVVAGVQGLRAGIYGLVEYKNAQKPKNPETTKCACGSGMPYSKCCEIWHDRGEATDPLILIKARYSAFAYCLPEYIMATTQKKGPEWNAKTNEWEKELIDFCNTYDLTNDSRKLGVVLEECKYQNDDKATLLFKALMLNKRDASNKTVELWEKSTVVREGSSWFYQKGSLEEYAGPLM